MIEDRGSTNGTFVNGLRIGVPKVLSEGDRIELGGTTLIVREIPVPGVTETVEHQDEPADARAPAATEADQEGPDAFATAVSLPPAAGNFPQAGGSVALTVHLEIDFAAGEASISIDAASEPVRLVLDSGRWQVSSPAQREGETND
jgi:hypothetical protein